MTFIMLLATAVGIVSAIALVVVGLVEAPWQLLLFGLLAALYGLQRQIWASESVIEVGSAIVPTDVDTQKNSALSQPKQADVSNTDSSSAQEPEGEELIYRGIRYRASQSENPPPLPDEKVEGIYRGQPWER
ncbi:MULTISPECIES: DUF4278 domain-containing protein [Cyanophyceae]|uniref:DUF4278 domain-containing protein n=1 Tax=Cyanophyceae TaxID=3028117 RepID=UPI0016893028|nr:MULTISPECIES: DUF4278 domain-containing protein [Cyanophyceae]MBD1917162.1 hypothetical protein [Phormidium sp. FACHB-77]MBD2030693.1 hypothetical protein [Phormidium sp. FACHB-322]MBD2050199.1 hypothetical protein [Leptolyngbya sp. FACHB-60]